MSSFRAFSYEEILTEAGKKNLPEELIVTDNSPEILLLLRLLSGSIKITHNYSDTTYSLRKNFFNSDYKSFGQNWRTKFPKMISEDINSQDIADFLKIQKFINRQFYKNILIEASHYIYASKRGSHTAAFIYIYRLLEKISYAFPLIYAAKAEDFINTFNDLNMLMSGDGQKKELGFFKKFIHNLYSQNPISQTSIDIHLNVGRADVQKHFFDEMKRVIEHEIIHGDTIEPSKLSINYCDYGSFIITIRNKYFHNMNRDRNNIDTGRIADPDLFFKNINDVSFYWLSGVFLEIFSHLMSDHQKVRRLV